MKIIGEIIAVEISHRGFGPQIQVTIKGREATAPECDTSQEITFYVKNERGRDRAFYVGRSIAVEIVLGDES